MMNKYQGVDKRAYSPHKRKGKSRGKNNDLYNSLHENKYQT